MKYLILIISILLTISCVQAIDIGDGSIHISSGDDVTITGIVNNTNASSGQIWFYTGNYENLMYGDTPITITKNTTSDKYQFSAILNKSLRLKDGKYKLYVQFNGKNNVQEVLYDSKNTKLYSPWIYVTKLDVSNNIAAVPQKAESFCKDNYKFCDDEFYNTTVSIEGPFIKFSDQHQVQNDQLDITKNGLLYIGGITNIDPSNTINVTLDYTQTVKANIDKKNPLGYYVWYGYLNISRLRSGDHIILIQSKKTDDVKSILTISEYIPTPVPTQVPIKYVRNEVNNFVSVTNVPPTPRPTATPIYIDDSANQFVQVVTATPTIIDTPQAAPSGAIFIKPTVKNSIAVVTVPPTSSGKLPTNIFIPIIGLLIIIYIMGKPSDKV